MVRRIGRGVDHLPRVLPVPAARRLRLLRLDDAQARAAPAGRAAHRAARREPRLAADHSRRGVEAGRRRGPDVAHPGLARPSPSGCPTSCSPPPARWCRRGSRAPSRRAPSTACSRCRTSPRCSRSSPIRSRSSRGSRRRIQSWGWSAGYVAVRRCCAPAPPSTALREQPRRSPARADGSDGPRRTRRPPPAPPATTRCGCCSPAMGSFMLLAVTNHITHDVASVPFLWILPLTLYLLTFILCFEGARLVPAPHLPRAAARGRGRDGVGAARRARHRGHQGGGAALLRRSLRDVHVLPRRARRDEARAALPHAAST